MVTFGLAVVLALPLAPLPGPDKTPAVTLSVTGYKASDPEQVKFLRQ
jgi:hypothetical protein